MKETTPTTESDSRAAEAAPRRDGARATLLENALASAVDAVLVFDRDFRYVYASPSAARLLGLAAEELVGKRWDEVHPAEMTGPWREQARRVFEERQVLRDEVAYTTAGGERIYEYIMAPIVDERGQAELIVSIARDVTERRRAQDALAAANAAAQRGRARATKLLGVTAAISQATTYAQIGNVIVNEAFDALEAESAVAYFIHADGRLVLAGARGVPESVLDEVRVLPLDAPRPLATAVRKGTPIWIESLDAFLAAYPNLQNTQTPHSRLQAVAAIPLQINDRNVGGVAFSFGSPRRFDEDERTFLLTLANHAALAAERCALRLEEELARTRLAILAEASRRFAEARLELQNTLDTIAREVAVRLRDTCAINLLSSDEAVLEPVAIASVDAEIEAATRKTMAAAPVRMNENSSLARVVKTGQPLLIPVVPREAWLAASARPEYREHHERYPIGTILIVPLRARARIIGTITVSRAVGTPPYTHDDENLLQDLADRAGLAIGDARHYEELGLERRRLDILAKASELLATSLDYETTLQNVIELALPTLGDLGFFDVLEESGEVRRLARAHDDPERHALLEQMRWPARDNKHTGLTALASGLSMLHPHIDEAWLAGAASSPEEITLLRRLGVRSMISVPLVYHRTTLGALTLFFADSKRRHSESDLRLARELARRAAAAVESARLYKDSREAIAVRDDFLSTAGHELNTPLAALVLQIQSLKRQAERDQVSPSIVERLAKTEGHVARLQKLISELLDVSRITAGRLAIHPEPMDLAATAKEVSERLAVQAASAGCTLALTAPESIIGAWDRLRIEQVLTNLVANAIKYGARHPIEVAVSADASAARVAVRDYGIGISVEDEGRIFGRFERAVSGRHYGGLGLGLWIARQIVEAHGGSIVFERPAGPGTKFIVELPLKGAT